MNKIITEIKGGYRLTVTSTDYSDDTGKVSWDGLSRQEAKLHIDTIQVFATYCGGVANGRIGEAHKKSLAEEIRTIVEDSGITTVDKSADCLIEQAKLLINGYGMQSRHYMCRMFESFTMEYFPSVIQIEDVTKEFE